ncbi:universal stress protein [Amycolatopsis sacchari]|uniref:Nucleotide-binding universal stress protein, UspA family n=1 Tax=Amycolatopsis sacchari TaxID=115433 RepID=A0A1I3KWM0_9PSEU|nr:universal stress protein [Amycolatopsis sacchari]SFI76892.1 Nucleotide-binding universal stress protein, UspA family [Amycolatopsis sacchari]
MNAPVVVGVDGTRQSLRAVEWAAEEAALRHLPLHVVNGFGIPDAFYGEALPPRDWLDSRRLEAEEIVREAAAAAGHREHHPVVEQESVLDSPVPLLLRRSEDATMLVVGSAGRGVLGDLVVGSVATALTAHAHCPVAVVRGEDRAGTAPVVAGVDGGPASEAVLALAFEEAAVHGVPLVAVHVWADADPGRVFAEAMAPFDFEPLREKANRVLAEALAGWREKFPDVEVRRVVEEDKPRQRLLDWSRSARMVVVGSRGRGGFTGLLLGSVSQALVQHGGCPVLVARG